MTTSITIVAAPTGTSYATASAPTTSASCTAPTRPRPGVKWPIKVILPDYANRPEFVERFEADAQHVAGLEHPHIVSLYDFWRSPEGAYLVMPYVRGGNLRRSIDSTRWDPAAAMRVLDQVGSALGHAHRRGIVHGDLNSTKVLLDDDANAYLFDFGIARRRVNDAESDRGVADDIRSFGFLVHELFTGSRTGAGEPADSVHWMRDDLPQGLDDVIACATDPDPARRYGRIDDCLRALRQAFGADVTTGPASPDVDVDVRNPYKGLRAFAEVDADDYFGRDRLVEQLSQRVAGNRLTVVVGPSGSGKSSLVKAGLVPRLRRDGIRPGRPTLVTEMYPGSYPFEELEAALLRVAVDRPDDLLDELIADDRGLLRATKQILPDDDSELLLVVDQFEELFSLTADASVRRLFLDNLVTIGHDERSRVRLVLTMRADFFDHPLEHPAFGELMAAGLVTIAMPDHDDLAQAISEPARSAGLELEAGLVPIITRDVAGEPGALPLMQYALTELVGARLGRQLTIDAYERTGGVIGALSSRAEDIYVGLPPSAQRVAEEVFVHLVAVDEDSDDTRRRVRRSELDAMGFNAQRARQRDRRIRVVPTPVVRPRSGDARPDDRGRPRGADPGMASLPDVDRSASGGTGAATTAAGRRRRLGLERPRAEFPAQRRTAGAVRAVVRIDGTAHRWARAGVSRRSPAA